MLQISISALKMYTIVYFGTYFETRNRRRLRSVEQTLAQKSRLSASMQLRSPRLKNVIFLTLVFCS